MSLTATTYFVDWESFVAMYQANPSAQWWHKEDAGTSGAALGNTDPNAPDWLDENPIEACSVYENFHFWTDFADVYLRMRRDIPARPLKGFDAFLGAFCPPMGDGVFAPLQDLGPECAELFYMTIAPQTAKEYLKLGQSLNTQALKKPFDKNYNKPNQDDDDEPEYERDDFDSVWSYWAWRVKASLKPSEDESETLSEDELTFTDFDHFESFIRAWIEVLQYAVQNGKGIVVTVA